MNIPEHLLHPGMTEDRKKFLEEFVSKNRTTMSQNPVFDTMEEAVAAVIDAMPKL